MPGIGGFIAPAMLRSSSLHSLYSIAPIGTRFALPAEDLLVERRARLDVGRHELVPRQRAVLVHEVRADAVLRLSRGRTSRRSGRRSTAMRPASITSNGGPIDRAARAGNLRGRRVDVGDGHVGVPVRRHAGHRQRRRSRRRPSRSSAPSSRRRRRPSSLSRRSPSRTARCRRPWRRLGRRSGGRPNSACRVRAACVSGMVAPRDRERDDVSRARSTQRTPAASATHADAAEASARDGRRTRFRGRRAPRDAGPCTARAARAQPWMRKCRSPYRIPGRSRASRRSARSVIVLLQVRP